MRLHFLTSLSLIKQIAQRKGIPLNRTDHAKLVEDANKNKEKLKKQWDKYQGLIESIIKSIVKNEWKENLNIQVFVFPDYIQIGACNCEDFKILFGCEEGYPGFGIVTICHEIIHMLIYKYRKTHKISRLADEVFVFLSAECELRKRLLNKEYFSDSFSGVLSPFHEKALQKSKELINSWITYLSDASISCKCFLNFIEKSISVYEKEEYNNIKLTDFIGTER